MSNKFCCISSPLILTSAHSYLDTNLNTSSAQAADKIKGKRIRTMTPWNVLLKNEQGLRLFQKLVGKEDSFTCNHSIGGCHCRDYMLDNTLIKQQQQ